MKRLSIVLMLLSLTFGAVYAHVDHEISADSMQVDNTNILSSMTLSKVSKR